MTVLARIIGTVAVVVPLVGCSGSTEDVRVTLCKNLTTSLQGSNSIEWGETAFTFRRPEYATTTLHYEVITAGKASQKTSACHFAYEALDDTAVNLANPIDAYETLPFAMSHDGRVLSDAELLQTVNAEQKRLGRDAIGRLERNAQDLAAKIRAGVSG